MVLVVDDDGSPEGRLKKRALENCEYGYTDFAIKCKRSRVFAIRDFPDGCGRSDKSVVLSVHSYENLADSEKGVIALEDETGEPLDSVIESRAIEVLGDVDDLLELVDASDDLALKMVHMVSSADGEEEELAELVDDEGGVAVGPLALMDHEASALSKEAIVRSYPLPRRGVSASRGFPITFGSNTRRISARRDFPLGCRNNTLADSQETYPKSTGFNVLDHKIANVDGKAFEEVVKSDIKQVKEVCEESGYKIQAQSGLDATRLGKSSQIKTLKEDTKGMSVKPPCDTNLSQTSKKVIQKHKRDEGGSEGKMEEDFVNKMRNCMGKVQSEKTVALQVPRISAARDFPLGFLCNTQHDSHEIYPKSIGFSGFDHESAIVEHKSFQEAVKSDITQIKEVSGENMYKIGAQSVVDGTRLGKPSQIIDSMGKITKAPYDTNLSQSSPKLIQNHRREESSQAKMDKNLVINIKNSTSQVQRGNPTFWQVNRVTVQALMATTKCQWRQSGIKRVRELSEESVCQVRAQAGVDGTRLLKPSQITNSIGESIKAPFDINLSLSSPKLIKKQRGNKGGSDGKMEKNLLNNTKNSMNQVQREKPSYSQASRVTVQALIAAKNCS